MVPSPSNRNLLDATIVVALSRNNVIGKNNQLPWKLRSDLQRFKKLTMGHALLMGRKTYDSIGKPLPGRQTIVLSRTAQTTPIERTVASSKDTQVPEFSMPNPAYARSIEEALELVPNGMHPFIVGGGEIFRETISRVKRMWITRVLADIEGDAFFPEWNQEAWKLVSQEQLPASEYDQWPTVFQEWIIN